MIVGSAGAVVFLTMIGEAVLSARHDRALRRLGAVEPPGDVYRVMQWAYPACFLLMLGEGALRSVEADALFRAGAGMFAAGKALKYWAIATLGPRWTFRVLVPPHSALVTGGPYRVMRHPNYLAVMGELAGFALMAHAVLTGPASVLIFAWLIARRIRVEERALQARAD